MKAVIMAGGEGTRLRPLTCAFPKPLAHICGKPIMHYVIELLARHGVEEAAVTLMYLPEQIKAYFGEEYAGVKLTYFTEESPLGTAGSVKNTMDFIGEEDFLVISADAMCDFDLSGLMAAHRESAAAATIALYPAADPLEYGIVLADEQGRVVRFVEKPGWPQAFTDTVNTGVYVLSPQAMALVPPGEKFDFSQDLFPLLLGGEPGIHSQVMAGYWCDVGGLGALKGCIEAVLAGQVDIRLAAEPWQDNFYQADVPPGRYHLEAPCYIGANVSIADGARIGPYAVLEEGCAVKADAKVKRSVLYPNVTIGAKAEIKGAILAAGAAVGENSRLFEGACIGENCRIEENVLVKAGIKIWPGKLVEADGVVDQNLVWGDAARRLFGEDGICGEFATHISAEFAAKLGACIGSLYPGEDLIVLDDGSAAAGLIKNALASGLAASGAYVHDIGMGALPMGMFAASFLDAAAGILCTLSGEQIAVRPFDQSEPTLPRKLERKIENAFFADDFLRAGADRVQPPVRLSAIGPAYARYLERLAYGKIKGRHIDLTACPEPYRQILTRVFTRLLAHVEPGEEHVGVKIAADGMRFELRDEQGEIIPYEKCLAILTGLLAEQGERRITIPCTAPFYIDDAALRYQGQVVRVPNYPLSAPEESQRVEIGFIDGCAGAVKTLTLLERSGRLLHDLAREIRESGFVSREVKTEKSRGYIMRKLAELGRENLNEFAEGIEFVNGKERALIIPSRRSQSFHIYAGGAGAREARRVADEFAARIKNL